ncbi:DUF1320 family protein [Caldimonas thermodepolymerans]|nr:DUF1320 family protein [Caldimonas thermodepolymerans]
MYETFGEASIAKVVTTTGVDFEAFLDGINQEIDAYVGAAVPLPPSEAAIKVVQAAAADLARYRLFRDAASELMRDRAEDAIKFLSGVAARKLALPMPADDPTTPEDESGLAYVAECGSAQRRMQRDQLKSW